MTDEPRWLNEDEQKTWLALLSVLVRLPAALDTQLQRDAGIKNFEYMLLAGLSEAPERRLRMSVLAAISELAVRVVVTVGPNGDPDALGSQPSNVHVARYIAQQELLPHCSGVVSHAGSGTFLATLAAGLPQVCLPQAADQFLNAAAAARAGCGIAVLPADFSPGSVRAAVERVLDDVTVRAAAERLRDEIAGMPSAASS